VLVVGSGGWCNGMDPDGASFAEMQRPSPDPAVDPAVDPAADWLALDQATVERLLAGELVGEQVPVGYGPVAGLLAALVAPPSQRELAGQAVALAQLRAVTGHRATVGGRVGRRGRARRRRRVGLAVVVVVGALSTGGVAAATGQLPGSIRDAARNLRVMVGGAPVVPTETGSGRPLGPTTGTGGPAGGGQGAGSAGGVGSRVVPGVAADGLCRAFLAGRGGEQGGRMDAVAFQALARAAGGPDKIVAYCQAVQPGSARSNRQGKPDPTGIQGHGPGGPPPDPGGGDQGQGGPPGTRSNDR
jgi:hypothetical protein